MALSVQNAWAALSRAARAHTKKNGSQLSQTDPKAKSREFVDSASRSVRDLVMERYGSKPYSSTNIRLDKIRRAQAQFFIKANDSALGMAHTLTAPKAPEPTQETSGRGQIRVDLDTSPVQTKDSVMYRNAGEGEESTIGEASRPNKRKPGLSSNLGINL